jgi:hypothetical protein
MKGSLFCSLLLVLVLPIFLTAQSSITGKLVDQSGNGLSGLQLQLYITPNVYSATSGTGGSFTFNTLTGVKSEHLPTGYAISGNYPNPFNPKTRFNMTLPQSGKVRINIYNLLGQKMMEEIERYANAEENYLDLELNGLPNGVYIARITLDEKYTVIRKLMLLYGSQHLPAGVSNTQLNKSTCDVKSTQDVKIDSLVITGASIGKEVFVNLPPLTGSSLDLGNLTVNQQQILITSVSSTSPTPLTPLALATAGIATNDSMSVTFFNSAGFSVSNTPIRVETDGTVIVAVPLYVDSSTSTVTNGTVSLVLSQGSRASAPVIIDIQNLPTLDSYGMQLGEVSHAFLVFRALLLGSRLGQFQAASLLFGTNVSVAESTLSTNLTAVLLARSDVDRVMLDTSTVITNGTLPNGTTIQWDKNSQDMMDRVIAVYLLQQFGNDTSSLTKVSARRPLRSPSRKALTPAKVADLKEIVKVIEDSRTVPDLVRDLQKSESGLDAAYAVLKAGSAYIGDKVGPHIGQKELGSKIGAVFSIIDIGRAAWDASCDLGALFLNSRYGGDPNAIAQDSANLNKDQVKLFDASISTLSFGFLEGVKAGTQGSITIMGLGLAFADEQILESLAGIKVEETALSVAGQIRNPFPSPNQGLGQITGLAAAQSSIDLCCFGAGALGIQGIADDSGYYEMFVPLNVSETGYSSLTLSAGDFISGSTWGSETVDLSGLNTSQPLQVPPLVHCTYTISPTSQSFIYLGGSSSFYVGTDSTCIWRVASTVDWIIITSNDSGIGPAYVNYYVAPNQSSVQRKGSINVQGTTFNITQDGMGILPGWLSVCIPPEMNVTLTPPGVTYSDTLVDFQYPPNTIVNVTATPSSRTIGYFYSFRNGGFTRSFNDTILPLSSGITNIDFCDSMACARYVGSYNFTVSQPHGPCPTQMQINCSGRMEVSIFLSNYQIDTSINWDTSSLVYETCQFCPCPPDSWISCNNFVEGGKHFNFLGTYVDGPHCSIVNDSTPGGVGFEFTLSKSKIFNGSGIIDGDYPLEFKGIFDNGTLTCTFDTNNYNYQISGSLTISRDTSQSSEVFKSPDLRPIPALINREQHRSKIKLQQFYTKPKGK